MSNRKSIMKADLKHAIHVWKMNYLIETGITPDVIVSDFGGYIEVSFGDNSTREVAVKQEEE